MYLKNLFGSNGIVEYWKYYLPDITTLSHYSVTPLFHLGLIYLNIDLRFIIIESYKILSSEIQFIIP